MDAVNIDIYEYDYVTTTNSVITLSVFFNNALDPDISYLINQIRTSGYVMVEGTSYRVLDIGTIHNNIDNEFVIQIVAKSL